MNHRVVGYRPEKLKADRFDVWVLLEQAAQESFVQGWAARHEQHPDSVANHLEHERSAVVVHHHFVRKNRYRDGVDEPSSAVWGEVEGHRLKVIVRLEHHRLARDGLALAAQYDWNRLPLEA